jgi:cobalt/nickel transport system permease protein
VLAVVLSGRPWFPLGVAACSAAWWVAAGLPLRTGILRLAAPLALAAAAAIPRAFLTGTTPLWSFALGPWEITATREGVLAGGLVAARILGSVSVLLVLCAVTPPHRIFGALRWAGVPRTWVEIAMLMYRYLFTLLEQAQNVRAAQALRLGYAAPGRAVRSAADLAGIVVLRSLDQAERSLEAMTARGCEGSLQIPPLPPLRRRDVWIACAALAVIALACFAVEGWPLWTAL